MEFKIALDLEGQRVLCLFIASGRRERNDIFVNMSGPSAFISSVQAEWLTYACLTWCNYMVWCS